SAPAPAVVSAATPAPAPAVVSAATLLEEGMRYLQQARIPPDSAPPPEGKEALHKLQQAQRQDPNNTAIDRALRLYAERHIVCTGLFEQQSGADAMVQRMQAAGVPAFQQPLFVKGKASLRTCIGPFLTQEEADKNLRQLRSRTGVTSAIPRIYKDPLPPPSETH
ncbi:MAG: SPOR domain-containing protein, partial [Magnetococcales bacterium]|nr:SPOR domain-containing protein [Magnetococcales bacterium]